MGPIFSTAQGQNCFDLTLGTGFEARTGGVVRPEHVWRDFVEVGLRIPQNLMVDPEMIAVGATAPRFSFNLECVLVHTGAVPILESQFKTVALEPSFSVA